SELRACRHASGASTPEQAHNDYLELMASGGIVGLALFAWFAAIVLKQARGNLHSQNSFRRAACFAALIAITGVAVHSLVDFGLQRMLKALLFAGFCVFGT